MSKSAAGCPPHRPQLVEDVTYMPLGFEVVQSWAYCTRCGEDVPVALTADATGPRDA